MEAMDALLPDDDVDLLGLRFAIIDLETSGGRPRAGWSQNERFLPAAEITEVGVVRMCGRILEGRYASLCAIEGDLPPVIQRLTGITPALLAGAPSWERVALRLADELEGRVWVAHHAPFDGSFLKAYLPEGLWRRHSLLCTRRLAKVLVPEATSCSLGSLCELLQLHNRRPHRALSDAEVTAELLQRLLARAEAKGMDGATLLAQGSVAWEKL